MKRLSFICCATLVAIAVQPTRAQQGDKLLASAQHKATIDGDLKGAIEDYKKIVAAAGANRALAAQALVRMAECYQKLGDAEARTVYERVIRDFPDQTPFVALARTRLGVTDSRRMISRRVATVKVGGVGYGTVSPDGHLFPFVNWNDGDLYLRDLINGGDRRLTHVSGLSSKPSQFAVQAAFSKDGRYVAYGWAFDTRAELRIIESAAAGVTPPRRLFSNEDVKHIWPDDWSADGKWLAVQVRRQDKTAQIGLVNVQDGSLRVLKSVDWRGATRLMFSPDSKYLAYDLSVADADSQRDVFILAIDGSRGVAAAVHPANDTVMGWSTDGSRLLFASDRSGTIGLWQLAVSDGRPQGAPDLIKPNIEGAPLGIARNGALYSLVHHPRFNSALSSDVQVATFDFETGRFLSPPVSPVQRFVGTNSNPSWSPDGKSLAYVSRREESISMGTNVIGICSVETGQVRELQPALNLYPPIVRWSADGRSLLTQGKDTRGRQGLFRIDAQTGAVSVIAFSPDEGEIRLPSQSPDGKQLYYIHGPTPGARPPRQFAVIERDLTTGNERDLARGPNIYNPDLSRDVLRGPNIVAPDLSPDGQHIIVRHEDEKFSALLLVPVRGGHPKEIIRVDPPKLVIVQSWTPDSQAVLVKVAAPGGAAPLSGSAPEVWRVPLDGSERRKLDVKIDGMTPFSVHPDGRQIAYALTERAKDDEVWVLENFLPSPSTKQP